MTDNEFGLAMIGNGERHTLDGRNRIRYIVADAFDERAKERQAEGRPDKAGLLRYIAGQIRHGSYPSKKSKGKASTDIKVVRERLVDGVSVSGL